MARTHRRRRRRRRRFNKKSLMSKVKKVVKKEVGKTRELKKLTSFVMRRPIRSLNTQWVGTANTPWENTVIYSITGGRMNQGFTSDDTLINVNTPKSLFGLRPAYASSAVQKVELGLEGGIVDSSQNVGQAPLAEGGIHILQGTQCFLKNFYCNIRINNAGYAAFTTASGDDVSALSPSNPVSQYIRVLAIETRKPLLGMRPGGAYNSVAQQILLQVQSGDGLQDVVPTPGGINCDSVSGFLNLSTIKRVIYDKVIQLGSGEKGNFKSQWIKRLKIPLNRKARFNYLYDQTDATAEPVLKYDGPWIYLVMFGGNDITQSLDAAPRVSMSSILTLYDD